MKSKTTKTYLLKQERKMLRKADKEWAMAVKARDGNQCVICGRTDYLNSHHIIPREAKNFRHWLCNGITLCSNHHRFSLGISAHRNPFPFFLWFRDYRPEQYKELVTKWAELL